MKHVHKLVLGVAAGLLGPVQFKKLEVTSMFSSIALRPLTLYTRTLFVPSNRGIWSQIRGI